MAQHWRKLGRTAGFCQDDPGLSDISHWTGQGWSHLVLLGKAQYLSRSQPQTGKQFPSSETSLLLLQASSPGKPPSSWWGQDSSWEGEQEPRRCMGPFLLSWAVGHLFTSSHVQWKDRGARGRKNDTRQSSSELLTITECRHREKQTHPPWNSTLWVAAGCSLSGTRMSCCSNSWNHSLAKCESWWLLWRAAGVWGDEEEIRFLFPSETAWF